MTKACVYQIRNWMTDESYVGSTSNFSGRRNQHLHNLRRNKGAHPRLQASWNMYGEAAFEFKIIERINDPHELKDREQHWIDRLQPKLNASRSSRPEGRTRWETIRRRYIDEGVESPHYHRYLITAPNGVQICTDNLNRFAAFYGLRVSGLARVATGQIRNHEGWRCEYIDLPNRTLSAVPKRSKSKVHIGYLLTNPRGVQLCTKNLNDFCKAEGLTRENMLKVARGLRKSCKGWKCEFIDSVD